MRHLLGLAITLLLAHTALAAVEAVTIITGRGESAPAGTPSSYTVPNGKVLIIDSIQFKGTVGNSGDLIVEIKQKPINLSSSTPLNTFINLGVFEGYKTYFLENPLRLREGEILDSNQSDGFTLWRGLLLDESDLFAALDVELDQTRIENGLLLARARVETNRPYRLRLESSSDLTHFSPQPDARIAAGAAGNERTVSFAVSGSEDVYVRATAAARP